MSLESKLYARKAEELRRGDKDKKKVVDFNSKFMERSEKAAKRNSLHKALDKKYKESRDSMPNNEHMSKRHNYKNSKGLGN